MLNSELQGPKEPFWCGFIEILKVIAPMLRVPGHIAESDDPRIPPYIMVNRLGSERGGLVVIRSYEATPKGLRRAL